MLRNHVKKIQAALFKNERKKKRNYEKEGE